MVETRRSTAASASGRRPTSPSSSSTPPRPSKRSKVEAGAAHLLDAMGSVNPKDAAQASEEPRLVVQAAKDAAQLGLVDEESLPLAAEVSSKEDALTATDPSGAHLSKNKKSKKGRTKGVAWGKLVSLNKQGL